MWDLDQYSVDTVTDLVHTKLQNRFPLCFRQLALTKVRSHHRDGRQRLRNHVASAGAKRWSEIKRWSETLDAEANARHMISQIIHCIVQ